MTQVETPPVDCIRTAIELGENFISNSGHTLTDEIQANSCLGIVLRLTLSCRLAEARIASKDDQIKRLGSALEAFVDYYTQAGIGTCTKKDEMDAFVDGRDDGFDAEEVFNVRLGRDALIYADLRPEPEGCETCR